MSTFAVREGRIAGLKIITPFYMEDERGFFLKSFEKDVFHSLGIDMEIYEDFESFSRKNVIRGLHFQTKEPQAKLVRALSGSILDVAVDLRKGSKTFGEWEAVILSDHNHEAFWIPEGFAHGFLVLSDSALVSYKCRGKYLKEYDSGICWNDRDIQVEWGISDPIVSEKDQNLMSLREYQDNFL